MAKPNQLKENKPKDAIDEENEKKSGGEPLNIKFIAVNILTTTLICTLFLVVSYVMQSGLLTQKLTSLSKALQENSDEETEVSEDEVQRGVIVDLGEFTMNLADTNARRYLKANVALEVSKTQQDLDAEAAAASSGGGHGGHGGEGAVAPSVSNIEAEMAQYKPAIRDAIISCLS